MSNSRKNNLLLKRLSRYNVHILLLLDGSNDKQTLDKCFKEKAEVKEQLTKNILRYDK